MRIYLVELTALNAGTLTTYRYATGNGYTSLPSDTPGNALYAPRVTNPGLYERHLWEPGTTSSAGSVSAGVVELANPDGKLDFLLGCDVDKRPIVVRVGDDKAALGTFQTVFRGTVKSLTWTAALLQINMFDRMAEISGLPLVTDRYGGTNSLPNGVDGTSSDLGGQYKPLLIGEAENFAPPCVNTSQLIYQISNRAITNLYNVWEGGAALTTGVQRTSLAALQGTAPAAGTYDWYLGTDGTDGAYFRLGSVPGANAVTAYARDNNSVTLAQAVSRVMTLAGVSAADVSGLSAVNSAVMGYWAGTGGATVRDALDSLCVGAGASWVPTRAGSFQLQRLVDPSTLFSLISYSPAQILTGPGGDGVTIIPTSDTGSIPPYQIEVDYAQNYTVQNGGNVQGSVTDARKGFLALQYRKSTVSTPAIWDPVAKTGRNPLSTPLTVTSQFRNASDASAEATRLQGLYCPTGRKRIYCSFSVPPQYAQVTDLGSCVRLTYPRYGFNAGINLLVVGMVEDHANDQTELFCWG